MRDELEVADLPGAWNDAYQRRSASARRTTATACCRTPTGRVGRSGTSRPTRWGRSTRPCCGIGCGVDLPDVDGQIAGRRVRAAAGLAARAHPSSRVAVRGRGADRASHRGRARSPPVDALPVGQVRPAVRTGRPRDARCSTCSSSWRRSPARPARNGRWPTWSPPAWRAIGVEVDEDAAGAAIGSQIGNLTPGWPRPLDAGTPIFLNAHLDTVPPPPRIRPEVRNGIVVNAEETILGADNKAAVAAMVAAVEQVVADGIDHVGDRAGADADGGGWPARVPSSSTSPGCKPDSGTATTTPRRSGTSSWPLPRSAPCACTSWAGRRTRGSPRSRAEAPSPPRRGRRGHAAGPDRCRRRPPTSD